MLQSLVLTFVLAGLAMIGPFATDTYLPSFQAIAQQFEVSPIMVQQTLSVYLVAFAVMTLFYGTLSDSFGRRPVILISLLIFAVASVGASLTNSFSLLLLFRGLQGASAGAGRVIGQVIVRDRFDGAGAQRMISNIAMVFGIAPVIAPIAGGLLHVTFGWRSNFVLMMVIALLLLCVCLRVLPETLPKEIRQPFKIAAIARNYWMAVRNARLLYCALAIGFAFGGFATYISSAPEFVMQILHLPETAFAWLFVPMIGGTVIGSAFVSKLSRRVRTSKLIGCGYAIMLLAASLNIGYTYYFVAAIPWAVMPIMLYTFGLSLAIPGMTVTALETFPEMRGLASSIQSFAQMLIFAIVSGVVAPLLYSSAFLLACGVAIGALISSACWITSRRPSRLAN